MKQGLTSLEEAVFAAAWTKAEADGLGIHDAFKTCVNTVADLRKAAHDMRYGEQWSERNAAVLEAIQKSVGGGE